MTDQCVHLFISHAPGAPMRCARCGRLRSDTVFLRTLAVMITAGCVLIAILACVVIVAQVCIAVSRH